MHAAPEDMDKKIREWRRARGRAGLAGMARGFFTGSRDKPMSRQRAYVQIGIFFILAMVLLGFGLSRYSDSQPLAGGSTTTGTVTHVDEDQHCNQKGSCSTDYVPTIAFSANGSYYSFTGPDSGASMNVGDQVQVSYDPNNPNDAHDLSAGEADAWVMIGGGILLILIAAGTTLHTMLRPDDYQ